MIEGTLFDVKVNLDDIVDYDETSNNEGLAHLQTIDSCINVDGIGAEDSDVTHIEVVDKSKVNSLS